MISRRVFQAWDVTVWLCHDSRQYPRISGKVSSEIVCRHICNYLCGFREKWISVNKVSVKSVLTGNLLLISECNLSIKPD